MVHLVPDLTLKYGYFDSWLYNGIASRSFSVTVISILDIITSKLIRQKL